MHQVPVSARVLWGNVASAVNSASQQIAAGHLSAAFAHHLAEVVFSSPQLRGERDRPGPGFRRSSCCLIYRLTASRTGATCGDCVLG
jgi:ferric iron reductase protein FhuF